MWIPNTVEWNKWNNNKYTTLSRMSAFLDVFSLHRMQFNLTFYDGHNYVCHQFLISKQSGWILLRLILFQMNWKSISACSLFQRLFGDQIFIFWINLNKIIHVILCTNSSQRDLFFYYTLPLSYTNWWLFFFGNTTSVILLHLFFCLPISINSIEIIYSWNLKMENNR